MKTYHVNDIAHTGFEIGLLLKGINGLLEVISGILLVFLNPKRLRQILVHLIGPELSEDPRDAVAHFLLSLSQNFSISTQLFSIIYLLSHGIIKLILVFLLRKKKLWAYPLSAVFLFFFIVYQLYRYSFTHSPFLLLLSVLDFAMILLTCLEYRKLKLQHGKDTIV